MDRETVRGLQEELERFGPEATYVILQDDRALELLREWVEQHRLG
jgi:hypothetical protein